MRINPDKELKKVGDYLKKYRLKANLTQWDVAELCGISNQYISNMERGLHLPSPKSLSTYIRHCHVNTNAVIRLVLNYRQAKLRKDLNGSRGRRR